MVIAEARRPLPNSNKSHRMDSNFVEKTDYGPDLTVLANLVCAGGTIDILFHTLPLSNQLSSAL